MATTTTTHFSTKWGVDQSDLSSRQLTSIMMVQMIATVLILAITRPRLVMSDTGALRVPQLSVAKVLVVSLAIVSLTYGHPYLVKC